MANARVKFEFKARNEAARKAALLHSARMIRDVSEETRRAVRALVVRAIREGIPPYEAAKMIRSTIGMTARQTGAAAEYRTQLLASGATQDRVDRSLEFFSRKKIRDRADTIARTEILGALNAGSLASWRQAQKKGILSKAATKKFIVTKDELLQQCPICRPMDGQSKPLNKPFVTGDGREIMYPPAHPNCRCTIGEPTPIPGLSTFIERIAPKWLDSTDIVSHQLMPSAGHIQTVFDTVLRAGNALHPAIFKPRMGGPDDPFPRPEAGTEIRDVLAGAIAHVLGLPSPVAIIRQIRRSVGSLQPRILNTFTMQDMMMVYSNIGNFPWPRVPGHVIEGGAIFDAIIANSDRNEGNVLFQLSGFDSSTGDFQEVIHDRLTQFAGAVGKWHLIDHSFGFMPFQVPGMSIAVEPGSMVRDWWSPATFTPWAQDHSLTRDRRDYWLTTLSEKRDLLLGLVEDSALNGFEKQAFKTRLTHVSDLIRLGQFKDWILGR